VKLWKTIGGIASVHAETFNGAGDEKIRGISTVKENATAHQNCCTRISVFIQEDVLGAEESNIHDGEKQCL
jgi:hypothetical protein